MIDIPGFSGLKKIQWKNLEPGMIIIAGAKINDTVPPELTLYPVLSLNLIMDLNLKYHFKKTREVIVAQSVKSSSSEKMGVFLRTMEKKLNDFNHLRKELKSQKEDIFKINKLEYSNFLHKIHPIINSSQTILNHYNSFEVKIKRVKTPSIFYEEDREIKSTDVFSNRVIHEFNFPSEFPFVLHIGLDYSLGMYESGKLKSAIDALSLIYDFYEKFLPSAQIKVYGFSDITNILQFPFSERDMERKGKSFSSFYKKILNQRSKNIPNFVLLLSDNLPENFMDTVENAGKLKRAGVDITQIYLDFDSPLSGTESDEKRKAVAETLGGNQISVLQKEALPILALEALDNFLGNLTLANKKFEDYEFLEFKKEVVREKKLDNPKKERNIKPFQFKKL